MEILRLSGPSEVRLCENVTLECEVQPLYSSVWWSLRGNNVSEDERYIVNAVWTSFWKPSCDYHTLSIKALLAFCRELSELNTFATALYKLSIHICVA